MNLVKNSYGVSYAFKAKSEGYALLGTLGGSSLNRKKKPLTSQKNRKERAEETKKQRGGKESGERATWDDQPKRENRLPPRSSMKIRAKIHSLNGVLPHLVFITLTFQAKVEDRKGVEVLKTFLNNVRKRRPDAEYLWVEEKQGKNK